MPTTFDDVKLGPCAVTFGALNIPLTKGGVTISVAPIFREIKVDQHGDSVVDDRIIGWNVKATVPMAKTDYDSLKAAALFLEENAAGVLVDKPVENAVGDLSEDVTLFLCGPVSALELKYGFDEERIYQVEFRAYPKAAADPAEAGNYLAVGDQSLITTLETVTFTCEDAGTDPVAGVKVSVVGHGSKLTNSAGVAIFYLVDGDYVYAAEKQGYNTAYDDITVAGADLPVPVTMTI